VLSLNSYSIIKNGLRDDLLGGLGALKLKSEAAPSIAGKVNDVELEARESLPSTPTFDY